MSLLASLLCAALISGVVAFALFIVVIELAKEVGPGFTTRLSRVALILYTLGGLAAAPIFGLSAVVGGAFALVSGLLAWHYYGGFVARSIATDFAFADRVVAVGLEHFGKLDHNLDGVVNPGDIERALAKHSFTAEERQVLEHMASRCSNIGHVTSTSMATGGHYAVGVVCNYGISRSDLRRYRDRLDRQVGAWRNK